MMNKIILSLFLSLTITGCASQIDPLPEYILIVPEDNLLSECAVVQPPSLESFMKTDSVGQLMLMTEAYNTQTKNINECNIRLYGLKVWKEEQIKNYKNKSKE